MESQKIAALLQLMPLIGFVTLIAVGGWVIRTWIRVKHGYPLDGPLEGAWGKAVESKSNEEAIERVRLLSSENAQLKAELGSVRERLAVLEQIATDPAERTAREIESLR